MGRAPSFRQADIRRAIGGAEDAGMKVAMVEITADGTIRLKAEGAATSDEAASAYDSWKAKRDAKAQ